jgi:S1-C subfamily serine protease
MRRTFLVWIVMVTLLVGVPVNVTLVAGNFVPLVQQVSASAVTILDRSDSDSVVGSGVIISEDGKIITAAHVFEAIPEGKIDVELPDGQIVQVVEGDIPEPTVDVAVLYVDVKGLTPIQFADSDEVQVGEWAMAMGAPYGFKKSVTVGIVSAVGAFVPMDDVGGGRDYSDLVQVETPINPGNSGGMVVNIRGELIGIAVLKIPGSDGMGFALSSNTIQKALAKETEIKLQVYSNYWWNF